jgi:sucrose-6-phosphate hydrolase SacC (GH32 family)
MRFDARKKTFQMNRQESGLTKFSKHFPTATIAPTLNNKTTGTLRLYIDRCSIEAFDGEGRFAMTNLVFPTTPYTSLTISSENGKAHISDLDIYTINIEK